MAGPRDGSIGRYCLNDDNSLPRPGLGFSQGKAADFRLTVVCVCRFQAGRGLLPGNSVLALSVTRANMQVLSCALEPAHIGYRAEINQDDIKGLYKFNLNIFE